MVRLISHRCNGEFKAATAYHISILQLWGTEHEALLKKNNQDKASGQPDKEPFDYDFLHIPILAPALPYNGERKEGQS